MTTICYKAGIMAGDKQTNFGSLPAQTTKVLRIHGWVVGGSGDVGQIHDMHEWIRGGMDAEKFPPRQRDGLSCPIFLIADKTGLYILDNSPHPVKLEQPFFAIGSGRDFAIAGMHLGLTAEEAVHLAMKYDTTTGLGVDVLQVHPVRAW